MLLVGSEPSLYLSTVCDMERFVNISVSGKIYRLTKGSLQTYPDTRLGKIASLAMNEAQKLCDVYNDVTMEFYFERSPKIFECIASLYRTGAIHLPDPLPFCYDEFEQELVYWQISSAYLAKCCCQDLADNTADSLLHNADTAHLIVCKRHFRERLWDMLEHPSWSKGGKILAAIYIFMLLLSTVLIILSSYEHFGHPAAAGRFPPKGKNLTDEQLANKTELMEWQHRFEIVRDLHYTVTAYFAAEFLLRFFASPNRLAFVREPLSIIDIISLVPYILVIILGTAGLLPASYLAAVRQGVTILRILRMLQLLRYAKHVASFKLMCKALFAAKTELIFLLGVVVSLVLILATIMYSVEYSVPNSHIKDIPTAMYWCFVTISTVGYGDIVPTGTVGKIVACIMTTCGVIFLALPVSIVVSKFTETYDKKHKVAGAKRQMHNHNKVYTNLPIDFNNVKQNYIDDAQVL